MPKFEREVEIDAPIEKVWDVLTDPNQWPNWFPGIETVSNITAIRENGKFNWTDEGKTGQGTILKMEPQKRLEIMTQMEDDKDSHTFVLRATGGFLGLDKDETKIEYTLDTMMGGGIITNFLAGGNPRDAIRVKKAMHAFRRLVENQ
jgi:uncharacterized protein YndB with AHSA1/START domain